MMQQLGSGDYQYNRLEENLARAMAGRKINQERVNKEKDKICEESDEIKALKEKINEAYLNKERVA